MDVGPPLDDLSFDFYRLGDDLVILGKRLPQG